MSKPIFIAASPNTQKDDLRLAWWLLFRPWQWSNIKYSRELEQKISTYLNGRQAVAFDSARSSLYALLKASGIGPGDEVLLPAFSCMVVANAVVWAGAQPVYVDSDPASFNFDLKDLYSKVSPHTKAILVQHTFGYPEDLAAVRKIVGPQVMLIEDLAHSLGGEWQGRKLGTIGDAAIITFGIEKVISGVRGGMVVVKDTGIAAKLKELLSTLPGFSWFRTAVALKNPIFWSLIIPVYYLGVGKVTLGRLFVWLGHKLGLFGNMIEDCEYETIKPSWLPARMSPALALLAGHQFTKLEMFNGHRQTLARIYSDALGVKYSVPSGSRDIFLRFPVLVHDRAALLTKAKSEHIVLGDWYKNILYAPERSLKKLGYTRGMCPNAEKLSGSVVNLPTHINVPAADASRIAKLVKPYLIKN